MISGRSVIEADEAVERLGHEDLVDRVDHAVAEDEVGLGDLGIFDLHAVALDDLTVFDLGTEGTGVVVDGGFEVTENGGRTFSKLDLPTCQFYHVSVDTAFPYRLYGAQQDNTTLTVASRTTGWSIGEQDWWRVAGFESGHVVAKPTDPNITYGGNYSGYIGRYDKRTDQEQNISILVDNPIGGSAKDVVDRFQWTFPIVISPHDPNTIYATSQYVYRTTNEGMSWTRLSADLTRNDTTKQGPSGGPITKDNTSVEYYGTIVAAGESPYEPGFLVTGSDDGLVHVSTDNGANWTNVTSATMPEWLMINSVEFDPFVKGGIYIAGTLYKTGDYRPYLFKTIDYGKTWTKITNGIDPGHFTRVVRADPKRAGLLYAGTETGMYISFDDGASWKSFQQNMPIVPITDLTIKNDNLIAATQGRGFYLIDDLTPLHQLSTDVASSSVWLFKPMPSYRFGPTVGFGRTSLTAGTNHPGGVIVHFYVADTTKAQVSLEFMESGGKLIKKY
jgi:photosystem II stability/assembly factor-like uncharacterized protein